MTANRRLSQAAADAVARLPDGSGARAFSKSLRETTKIGDGAVATWLPVAGRFVVWRRVSRHSGDTLWEKVGEVSTLFVEKEK